MGWFWGSSNDDSDKSKDPLKDLTPGLREFLNKESPVKYNSSNPPPAPTSDAKPHPTTEVKASIDTPSAQNGSKPVVPSQSLYKDGRYADLWKQYRPKDEVEAECKSDNEKIQDVIEGYNHRKAQIGFAALENCAMEQWDVNECFIKGGAVARMTLCRAENRKFERCYTMQAKFLKALGYLSTFDRPPEVDEQIQMHADTLYHRMLAQEEAIQKAKTEGLPIPIFPPLLSSKGVKSSTQIPQADNKTEPSQLKTSVQKGMKKRLEGLNEEERLVEERAIKAEIQAAEQVAGRLGSIYAEQDEERKKRKEQGRETISDKFFSVFRAR